MDVFSICGFETPSDGAVAGLKAVLSAGMPANVLVRDIRSEEESQAEGSEREDPQSTMLHVICSRVDPENEDQVKLAGELTDVVFQYGASWMQLDSQNKTPGCICLDRKLPKSLYDRFVQAGVRSEIFIQRMTEPDSDDGEADQSTSNSAPTKEADAPSQPDGDQNDYLASKLSYDGNGALKTDQKDGVMMDWETPIMKRSAQLIAQPKEDGEGRAVLNIGFGLGIIDGFIQEQSPSKHYIIEAHPDVLKKMKADGWYKKPNVRVLEGTWKTVLPKLLDEGVTFDGIYYDTFSEHYRDMLDLFDYVCGLLEFDGTFSFFNGLGADRQVCYDVYKEVVDLDLQDHGLVVKYEDMPITVPEKTWDDIKRSYFNVPVYSLPVISFMS